MFIFGGSGSRLHETGNSLYDLYNFKSEIILKFLFKKKNYTIYKKNSCINIKYWFKRKKFLCCLWNLKLNKFEYPMWYKVLTQKVAVLYTNGRNVSLKRNMSIIKCLLNVYILIKVSEKTYNIILKCGLFRYSPFKN